MADTVIPIVTGESHHAVAYALLLGIAKREKKDIFWQGGTATVQADAEWVLSTYLRCLKTTMGAAT